MVSSNKNDDDGSGGTGHMLPGTNCASVPRYVLDISNTCTNDTCYPFLYPLASPSLDGYPVVCLVFCVAKLLRLLPLYGNTSIQFTSLEGVSFHLLSFNILIILFVPVLLVDLLILLGDLLVSIPWKALVNVVLISYTLLLSQIWFL